MNKEGNTSSQFQFIVKSSSNDFFVHLYKANNMTRQALIQRTIKVINTLPDDKIREISEFADFLIKRDEEAQLTNEIQKLTEQSQTFDFLKDEEDIYTVEDLKEVYNG